MDGSGVTLLIVIGFFMFAVISGIAMLSCHYTLDGIKSKTVGDGQHGTARFATKQEIRRTFTHVDITEAMAWSPVLRADPANHFALWSGGSLSISSWN